MRSTRVIWGHPPTDGQLAKEKEKERYGRREGRKRRETDKHIIHSNTLVQDVKIYTH